MALLEPGCWFATKSHSMLRDLHRSKVLQTRLIARRVVGGLVNDAELVDHQEGEGARGDPFKHACACTGGSAEHCII